MKNKIFQLLCIHLSVTSSFFFSSFFLPLASTLSKKKTGKRDNHLFFPCHSILQVFSRTYPVPHQAMYVMTLLPLVSNDITTTWFTRCIQRKNLGILKPNYNMIMICFNRKQLWKAQQWQIISLLYFFSHVAIHHFPHAGNKLNACSFDDLY